MMYTITHRHDDRDVYDRAVTIDGAIHAVKIASREHGRAVVRDNGRIRVIATNGKAIWVTECKRCKGAGCVGDKCCLCLDGSPGRGLVEDSPA